MDKDTLYSYNFDDIEDKRNFIKYVISEVKTITDTRHISFEEYDNTSCQITFDKYTNDGDNYLLEIVIRKEREPYFKYFTKTVYEIRLTFGERYDSDSVYGDSCAFNMSIDADTYNEIYKHATNTLQIERTKAIGDMFIAYRRDKNINSVTKT